MKDKKCISCKKFKQYAAKLCKLCYFREMKKLGSLIIQKAGGGLKNDRAEIR